MLRAALAIISMTGALAVSVPGPTPSGHGSAAVSGYVVSDVSYDDGGNPGSVQFVHLRLDKPAASVGVRLGPSSSWTACSPTSIRRWACAFKRPVAVVDIQTLEVVASGSFKR